MKKFLILFLCCFSYLNAWEFHSADIIPEEGQVILTILPETLHDLDDNTIVHRSVYRLTRYTDSKNNLIKRGCFSLKDSDLLDLFKGDVPFSFEP